MVRCFEDRSLGRETVEAIVASAGRAPSAGFTQGVELLVLVGAQETARYWDVALPEDRRAGFRWPGLLHAPLIVVVFAHEQAYIDRYAEPDKRRARRLRSGHGGLGQWPAPWWIIDASFSALLVLLTAVDRGLGALFFGVFRPDEVRDAFGVPDAYQPVGAVAVGYPAPDQPSQSLRRGRRPVQEVIHRGHW